MRIVLMQKFGYAWTQLFDHAFTVKANKMTGATVKDQLLLTCLAFLPNNTVNLTVSLMSVPRVPGVDTGVTLSRISGF